MSDELVGDPSGIIDDSVKFDYTPYYSLPENNYWAQLWNYSPDDETYESDASASIPFTIKNDPQDAQKATYPNPPSAATIVDIDVDLGWLSTSNVDLVSHDIYFSPAEEILPTVTYAYDYAGRRISKTTAAGITEYVYDGPQVIAEYEDGVLARKFIYGPGLDEPIAMIAVDGQTQTWYFYHYDGLGSVVALSNTSGAIVEAYAYDVFGTPTISVGAGSDGIWRTGDDTTDPASAIGNPYMFTGRRYDPETGLYYYRARMYSPELGRFMQPDPIGYGDGMNLYSYVGNNPISWVDPWGLCQEEALKEKEELINFVQETNKNSPPYLMPRHFPEGPWWYWDVNDCANQSIHQEYKIDHQKKMKYWGVKKENRSARPGGRDSWRNRYWGNHTIIIVFPKGNNDLPPFVLDVWIGPWESRGRYGKMALEQALGWWSWLIPVPDIGKFDYEVEIYSYDEFVRRYPYDENGGKTRSY